MAGPSSAGLLAGCERCGGTWLDHEELGLFARDSVTLESAAFIRAIDENGVETAAQKSAYRTASRPEGGCPMCGQVLV
jgi:Zn-finger nucleic acid-binding protein